jgi:hypothetical protein
VRSLFAGLILNLLALPAVAGQMPQPPCAGGASFPAFGSTDGAPAVEVWRGAELAGWEPPACIGFGPLDRDTVVTTAGRFSEPGGAAAIAARIAHISARLDIKAYSVHDRRYKQLYKTAFALDDGMGPSQSRRADFTGADLQPGRALRFWEEENSLLQGTAYRLTVRERTENRIVYSVVNESALTTWLFTAVRPGEFRQLYVLEREQDDVWRFYGYAEARARLGPFKLSSGSYINRANAYFHYVAGQPTDRDPPLSTAFSEGDSED